MTLGKLQLALTLSPQRERLILFSWSLSAVCLFFDTWSTRAPYLLMHGGLMTPVFAALVLRAQRPHPISAIFSWRPLLLIGRAVTAYTS